MSNKVKLLFIALTGLIVACTSEPAPKADFSSLTWLQNADPANHAKLYVSNDKLMLWGLKARKGYTVPGIDKAKLAELEKKCPTQVLDQFSDYLRSDEERALKKAAMAYMTAFNQAIQTRCK